MFRDDRIGVTRFACGCTVHTEPDVNGITPWLEHCFDHTTSDELLERLEQVLAAHRARQEGR
jgi:hypothetical protein